MIPRPSRNSHPGITTPAFDSRSSAERTRSIRRRGCRGITATTLAQSGTGRDPRWPILFLKYNVCLSGDRKPTSKNVFGGPDVEWCYGGFELEAMDSHGGWIATPSDLARFAASLDVAMPSGSLNAGSIQQIFSRPPETGYAANGIELSAYYVYGWHVESTLPEGTEQWHDGLFRGSSALLMRRSDGIVWALLFNTDNDDRREVPAEVMTPRINRLADSITKWPA